MTARPILIRSPEDRRRAAAACLAASLGMEVIVQEPPKTRQQEKHFHARLREFAKAPEVIARWGRRTQQRWKDEIVKLHFGVEIVPSLLEPGEFIAIRPSTTRLSVRQYCDLTERLFSIGAEVGHVWAVYRPGDELWEAQQEQQTRAEKARARKEKADHGQSYEDARAA